MVIFNAFAKTLGVRYDNVILGFYFIGSFTILLVTFHYKPHGWVTAINVVKEALFVIFLLDDKCVIHIPQPHPRG